MAKPATFFVQACPTCGRPTRIRVEWLGRQVCCAHCRAVFEACQPGETRTESLLDSAERWLAKAEELLRAVRYRPLPPEAQPEASNTIASESNIPVTHSPTG